MNNETNDLFYSEENNQGNAETNELFNMSNSKSTSPEDKKQQKKLVQIIAIVVVASVLLILIFGSKTLTCSYEDEMMDVKMTVSLKTKFWFNKSTSVTTEMELDLSDLDEEDAEDFKDSFLEDYEEDDDVKIKDKGDKVIITRKEDIDDEDVKSPKEVEEYFEDAMEYTCK